MEHLLPQELEEAISGDFSHLILKPDSPDLSVRLRSYLDRRGIAIHQERAFRDHEQKTWLLLSFEQHTASTLAMELIEEGFSGVIAGIDAKSF